MTCRVNHPAQCYQEVTSLVLWKSTDDRGMQLVPYCEEHYNYMLNVRGKSLVKLLKVREDSL